MISTQIFTGTGTARVVDMTYAGRRGKKVRQMVYLGGPGTESAIFARIQQASETEDYDALKAEFEQIGLADDDRLFEEQIRGVDAPRPLLTAGVEGLWSAKADADGVVLRELNDVNEWTEITFGQSKSRAYTLAAKVWSQVKAATTRYQVSTILRQAGIKLHGYCGLD